MDFLLVQFDRYTRYFYCIHFREVPCRLSAFCWFVTVERQYNNNFVCFILISSEDKTDSESWTFWSDDSGAATFGDGSLDEQLKETIWKHVGVCENVNKCFDGCKKSRKAIFGKEFDNVCGTAICFKNPDSAAVECLKIIVEIRKNEILKSTSG